MWWWFIFYRQREFETKSVRLNAKNVLFLLDFGIHVTVWCRYLISQYIGCAWNKRRLNVFNLVKENKRSIGLKMSLLNPTQQHFQWKFLMSMPQNHTFFAWEQNTIYHNTTFILIFNKEIFIQNNNTTQEYMQNKNILKDIITLNLMYRLIQYHAINSWLRK